MEEIHHDERGSGGRINDDGSNRGLLRLHQLARRRSAAHDDEDDASSKHSGRYDYMSSDDAGMLSRPGSSLEGRSGGGLTSTTETVTSGSERHGAGDTDPWSGSEPPSSSQGGGSRQEYGHQYGHHHHHHSHQGIHYKRGSRRISSQQAAMLTLEDVVARHTNAELTNVLTSKAAADQCAMVLEPGITDLLHVSNMIWRQILAVLNSVPAFSAQRQYADNPLIKSRLRVIYDTRHEDVGSGAVGSGGSQQLSLIHI